jgi:tRNA pseudouridine38-40 synthase
MRNIRLVIAYDGTDFCGWQRQSGGARTVQGLLEGALEKIHRRPVGLTGSGRTDSGVHAAGQAANFYTGIQQMDAERFVPALNSLLPRDLRILSSAAAPRSFHARFDARSRTYRYFFICGRRALPFESRFALQLQRAPDLALLNGYCRFLRGEFDCTVFAAAGDASAGDAGKSRRRYIFNASFFIEGERLVFEIQANAFLWKMVRSLAGTLLFYEKEKTAPADFGRLAASGRRELAGPTLPPQGLFLWKVEYASVFRAQSG